MKAFRAAHQLITQIATVYRLFANNPTQLRAALADLPEYKSQGKGGKRPHRSVGTKTYQRMMVKKKRTR